MRSRGLAILSVLCLGASLALACRYTVRDIGFIDLAGQIYTAWLVTESPDDTATAEALAGARETLDLSNVGVKVLDARTRPDHPAAATPGVVLEGPGGRFLPLGPLASIERTLAEVVRSPLRDDLMAGSVASFCTILLLDSTDAPRNAAAVEETDQAIAHFEAVAPSLPRAVSQPIRIVRVPAGERARDRVALWGLGLDEAPADQPAVAVLYGRLKLAGPVLVGGGITARTLASQLSLVGESCECEADRDWVNEASLPHRWDEVARRNAAAALGFDPGSPMVMAEAVRIIERGVLTTGGLQAPRTAEADTPLDASFFGYSEFTIGEPTTNAPEVALRPTAPIEHRTIDPGAPPPAGTVAAEAAPRPGPAEQAAGPEAEPRSAGVPVSLLLAGAGLVIAAVLGAAWVLLRSPAA